MSKQQATLDPVAQEELDSLRERAEAFSKAFANAKYEKGEAQTFLIHLCQVFGLDSVRSVSLEHRVQKSSGKGMEFVDGFFPGLLLVEMKSSGKDLQAAYEQAKGYVSLLKNPEEMPRYIMVSDFQSFHLYDLEAKAGANSHPRPTEFRLADLRNHVDSTLAFLSSYERVYQDVQVRITTRAAGTLTHLHDALKAARYPQKDMQTFLVRTLFCLFAEDTELFGSPDYPTPFYSLIEQSQSNAQYLGDAINRVFTRLNTAPEERDPTPYAQLTPAEQAVYHFPYVNGDLFAAPISPANFDENTRQALLKCCDTDWSLISPDIFGTMFQNLMHWDDEAAGGKGGKRRDFGAHYTSERNILRAIRPLFVDALTEELKAARSETKPSERKRALLALYDKLPTLTFLDPACGCGNFLVVAYRELRRIEMELIADLFSKGGQSKGLLDVKDTARVNVAQFYGIELDPTAAEIATVAMWLTDHQLNRQAAERFGKARPSIPLRRSAHIAKGQNALQLDWNSLLPAAQCSYIVGNPPFLGKKEQNAAQKSDMALVFKDYKNYGVLDYVSAWYVKAAAQMRVNPAIKAAFVSTNSITQGEQVAVLWQPLVQAGVHIHFAHRTFKWSNEGSSVAAVHCVIVGFGMEKPKKCSLWDYRDDITAETKPLRTRRLNAYLVDAPPVSLVKRSEPLFGGPAIRYGSMPIDDGHLILSPEEHQAAISENADNAQLIRPYTGGDEFLNNLKRYCLWLNATSEKAISSSDFATQRIEKTEAFRLGSTRETTRKLGLTPHLFGEIRQPKTDYLLLPKVSSEHRTFMPIGFVSKNTIASGSALIIPNAALVHFAVLSSSMHNAWLRAVCGRMKSDYQYSASIVYNNFPWPEAGKENVAIEAAGQAVLDARAKHKGKSLAWLYNPETMPSNLQTAHDELDDAVDEAYAYFGGNEDAPRVAFLFERYQQLTTLIPPEDEALETTAETKTVKPSKRKSIQS
jgi:type I restriction-modification system DNA methylase subunit